MRLYNSSERLKQIMRERGLKQVDILNKSLPFQKKLGIKLSKSLLSKYVNGGSTPHQNSIYLLSKVLDVDEGWLMGYDVPKERIPDEERIEFNQKTKVENTQILSQSEQKLLNNYNQLNDNGKQKASDYVEDLAGNRKYLKNTYTEERVELSKELA